MLDGFQAGLSWRLILHRRAALRQALPGVDPAILASDAAVDILRILQAPGMIRSHQKIQAVLHNARAYQALRAAGIAFAALVWAVVGGSPRAGDGHAQASTSATGDALSRLLRQRGFQFVGPRICQAWAQTCDLLDDHEPGCAQYRAQPGAACEVALE